MEQEQQLSLRQIESLKLLTLPLMDLQEKINQELESNPVLEADLVSEDILPQQPDQKFVQEDEEATFDRSDNDFESDEWQEYPGDISFDNTQNDFVMNSLHNEETLQDELLTELSMQQLPAGVETLAKDIIGSLDEAGYLNSPLEDIAMVNNAKLAEAEEALKIVQSFDPPGIGARSLAECLILQLEREDNDTDLMVELIRYHLDDIAQNRAPMLAKKFNLPLETINQSIDEIKMLNPCPGSAYSGKNPEYIIPECTIALNGKDEFIIEQREKYLPKIYVSERYTKMLEEPGISRDDKNYLKDKINSANELLKSLAMRENTIYRLTEVIIKTQPEFLREGPEKLHPLTMRQAGEMLELHESTVSKAVSGKYVDTPQGVFPYRYFFSAGFVSQTGEALSNRAVMEKIKEMIANEDSAKPLSDEDIAQELKKTGLSIARRTVAKYREGMNIPSSSLRKSHR